MNFPNVITTPCIPTTPPPPDPRCADPAFAKAYPDICSVGGSGSFPVLVIKPAVALTCALGPIVFTAYIDQGGVETQVTGAVFSSSDPTKAVIGANSGTATGIAAGTVTITAAYNGLTSSAELTVLGTGGTCCDSAGVATMLVVDVSKSMSLSFGNGYSTKEAYAVALASQYASQTNYTKDLIGLITFDSTPSVIIPLPGSPSQGEITDVTDALALVGSTPNLTGIGLALQAATSALSGTSAPIKVIVLLSDGEDKDNNSGNTPLPIAENFQNTGGIIICVGIRAHDAGFNLLNGIATGGFFLNGYPSNAADTLNELMGLKGYLCAGNCTPPGDVFVATGATNYTGFIHWDVTAGSVDLKGRGFLDLLVSDGLYVDLSGSPGAPPIGTLTSKTTFNFVPGVNYRLSCFLAGNQQVNDSSYAVKITIGDGSVFQTTVSLTNYLQPFTKYSFNFTVNSAISGKIAFQQLMNLPGGGPIVSGYPYNEYVGNLLDTIELDDLTNGTTMLFDDFNNENLKYVPPACGPSVTIPGYFGYSCYGYGCLTSPPPAQTQDPNPLNDIEAGYVPPTQYSSTKSFTATCPGCQTNPDGSTACTTQLNPVTAVPVMTGYTSPSGTVTTSSDIPSNPAWQAFVKSAVGTSGPVPAWKINPALVPSTQSVTYQFPAAQTVLAFAVTSDNSNNTGIMTQYQLQGSNDGSTWNNLTPTFTQLFANGDRIRASVQSPGAYLYYRLNVSFSGSTPIGIAYIEYFVAATNNNGITKSATATSFISQADADAKATSAAQALALTALAYAGCAVFYTATESATVQCPCGTLGTPNSVTASASATSYLNLSDAQIQATAAATAAANAQLNCTLSNNTAKITISDSPNNQPFGATPYPSVQYVTPTAQHIVSATVSIIGLSHTYPQDVSILLVSPTGKSIVLMSHCGGSHIISGVNLTFSDGAGSNLPIDNPPGSGTPIVSGTFKPTQNNTPVFPGCAPKVGYLTTLASLVGDDPSGSWALYVVDDKILDGGSIANGWTLNLTTV